MIAAFNLDGLDQYQREAALFDKGAALCVAGPGSGKTRLLTHRVARLIHEGHPVRSILAITFANNAAEEMRVRVGKLIGMEPDDLKATISTFHSLGYRMILRNRNQLPFKLSYAPIDLAATSRILRMTAGNREQLGTKLHVKILRSYISLKKREDIDCDQALAQDPNDVYALAYSLFEAEKHCQPPGTKVLAVSSRARFPHKGERFFVSAQVEWKDISSLKDGDLVCSWRKKDGRTMYVGRKIKIGSRHYAGDLLTLNCAGHKTKVTPNHWCWAKFNKSAHRKWFVYLMYREGFGFRVGVCKYWYGGPIRKYSGFSSRTNGERASKFWILRCCENERDAEIYEESYSIRYGITKRVFEDSNLPKKHQAILRRAFKGYFATSNDPHRNGLECLRDHYLDFYLPLLEKGPEFLRSHACSRFFKIAACNLIPEIMDLPNMGRAKWVGGDGSWKSAGSSKIVSVSREEYKGPVYSLDVETDHTYVADGIIVGNSLGILDFDDMIFLAWRLLRDKRAVLLAEQARCEYLMIDEFHDTDITQLRMAQAISKPQENVLCVCDSNQAIYSWRGADYRICLDFGKYFPEHQKFFLATNYRSLPHIVNLYKETITGCPSLIAGFLEKIFPFRKHPEPTEGMPEFVEFATDNAEAEWVTDSIAKWRAKGERDFAVLYRTNRQACLLEEALFRKEIPYIVLGACSFFNRAEVKDLLAFLRILDNRDDNSALERIVKSQAECSKYLGAAFLRELAKAGDHWFQNLRTFHSHKRFQVDKARGLYDFIEQLDIWTKNQSVNGQLQIIAEESGLMESLLDNEQYEESADNDAAENIPQVIRVAGQFKSRQDFLSYVVRVSAASERRYDPKESPVQLMTVHRAKGKEFGIVYFVGVSDDIIPHKKSQGDPDAVEEEQRIAYVGISRAKDRLYVTCFDQPSRFLSQRFAAGQKIGRVNYAEEQKPLVAVRTENDPCD